MRRLLSGSRFPAACTIVTRNFLSYARIVGSSYLRHHPGTRFYVLVVDGLPEGVSAGPGLEVIEPQSLDLPGFHELCFKYDVVELSTAVKPAFLTFLLEREEAVVYLDPDILVFRPFIELRRMLRSAPIALTPHILSPIPMDGLRPNETDMLISGAYNLGFVAVRRSADTASLLSWWNSRLQDGCRIDVPNGLFTDQKWIDLVPGYFDSVAILRDPTYNVAFWNLHERGLERRGLTFSVDGRPIAFYHFSGYTPTRPTELSKHQTRTQVAPGTPLSDLLSLYTDLHMRHGFATCSEWEYAFSRFPNGIRVNLALRKLYLNLDEDARARFGNPFEPAGAEAFLDWATRPRAVGMSRFLESLYRLRYDVAAAFPDVNGRDRDAYLDWARVYGASEMGYEQELVRDDDGIETEEPEVGEQPNGNGSEAGDSRPSYDLLVDRVRTAVATMLPPDSTVAVVSKGDERLLELAGMHGWHFPRLDDGTYAGYYPKSSEVAIGHLEQLRQRGAGFFVLPSTAFWWLDHYGGFREHLDRLYRRLAFDDGCLIYDLER
jgi:hypothetical protein